MSLIEVKIPPMGESISSGILAKWHVADGDVVKKDQALFELETDKITSEGVAEAAGRIVFEVPAGAEVKIGQVVAIIHTDVAAAPAAAPSTPAPAPDPAEPVTAVPAPSIPATPATAAPSAPLPTPAPAAPPKPKAATPAPQPSIPAKAPPPAAASANVPRAIAASPSALPSLASAGERQVRRKMSPLRQRIAQRLVAAQHEAAMLTTFNEVDMGAIVALRAKYQDDFVKKNGVKLGFMSFFVRAVVAALKEVPAVNTQLEGDHIVENRYYDIGVAVSTEKGLMVPVVRGCDTLGMAEIEKSIGEAAKKARESKITLADLEGGVFTITNGGIFGSMLSTPIINPPQSAILGLHAITDRPVALNGQVVIRPMMYLALSYDHRIIDGKEAVTFLVKVKQAIEDPSRLLLGV